MPRNTPFNPEQVVGEVFRHVELETTTPDHISYDQAGNYLFIPAEDGARRIVLFHATDQEGSPMILDSREDRMDLPWRRIARGPGLYGGNTPAAAASSLPGRGEAGRIHAYMTDPVELPTIIDERQDPSYYLPMIRAQFDGTFARNMVAARAASDGESRVRILSPGLVSLAKADAYVSGAICEKEYIPRTWIRVVSREGREGAQTIHRIGTVRPEAYEVQGGALRKGLLAVRAVQRVARGALGTT